MHVSPLNSIIYSLADTPGFISANTVTIIVAVVFGVIVMALVIVLIVGIIITIIIVSVMYLAWKRYAACLLQTFNFASNSVPSPSSVEMLSLMIRM